MTAFNTFVGPSYESPAYRADVEQTINYYTQTVESGGRVSARILCPMPGFETFATTVLSPIRATFAQDGRMFAVVGFGFLEVFSNGTSINRGTVANDALPATIASSGDAGQQLGIVAGGHWYNYDLTTDILSQIAAAGTGLVQGGYLDGFFWALDDTSTFHLSNLLDGTTWDPLQIAQRNDASDRWTAGLTIGKYIWLWGSETSTVLYDSGSFPFPFTLVPGVLINRGIGPVFSACDVNGAAVWLEQNRAGARMVVRGDGFGAPVRLSNHAVEFALARYSTVDDAVAFAFEWEGHPFYQINFPTANDAWAVDVASGEWFKPLFWDSVTATWNCSRAQYHCVAFGRHLVGDRATGTIYALSGTVYTDAGGVPMRRTRRVSFPRLFDSSDFVNLLDLELLGDVGIGLVSGQGVDPQAMIRFSRDGGRTWGNEHFVSLGAMGEYGVRVFMQRLMRYRDGKGVLEVNVSDPVPVRWIGAEFTYRRGVR